MTIRIRAGELDKRIRIERPIADNSFDGAGSGSWDLVAGAEAVAASVVDSLPRRAEKESDGITTSTRSARVRMRYRPDITPDMRFVHGTRVMMIVSGPAELGRRGGLEFMVEDYRPAGNAA